MRQENERRNYVRIPVDLLVNIERFDKNKKPNPAFKAINFSEGGIFITTDDRLEVNDPVEIEYFINEIQNKITVVGVVRRLQTSPVRGVGVEITFVEEEDERIFLESLKLHRDHVEL